MYKRQAYTVTIRSCDELDTRVDAVALNQAMLAPSFASPLDAHCNAARCLAYAAGSWEIFVENPDRTPWLEISFAPRYVPHPAGQPYTCLLYTSPVRRQSTTVRQRSGNAFTPLHRGRRQSTGHTATARQHLRHAHSIRLPAESHKQRPPQPAPPARRRLERLGVMGQPDR